MIQYMVTRVKDFSDPFTHVVVLTDVGPDAVLAYLREREDESHLYGVEAKDSALGTGSHLGVVSGEEFLVTDGKFFEPDSET